KPQHRPHHDQSPHPEGAPSLAALHDTLSLCSAFLKTKRFQLVVILSKARIDDVADRLGGTQD
ncbi:MAG: hypothetical protein ACRECZ_09330, partial [Methylocella sp.]